MTVDRLIGILCVLLGAGMFHMSQQIAQPFADSGDPGPRLLPMILSGAFILLGATLALRRPRSQPAAAATAGADDAGPTEMVPPPPLGRRLAIGITFVIYLALFERLGFSLASLLFLAVTMSLLDELTPRRIMTRTLVALVVVLLVGLLLSHVLVLPVPGIWFA